MAQSPLPEENSPKAQVSYENFISIARDLIEITDKILRGVVTKTEEAALEIGEKIQTISSLSEEQSKAIKKVIENMYEEGTEEHQEVEDISKQTNSLVDEIFENASQGNMSKVEQIAESNQYKGLKKKSGAMARNLENISMADSNVAETLAPVIMALQFQDTVRQSLENVIRAFNVFFHTLACIKHEKLVDGIAEEFWMQIEGQFTTTSDRGIIRKVVYGIDAKEEEKIAEGGSDLMFF